MNQLKEIEKVDSVVTDCMWDVWEKKTVRFRVQAADWVMVNQTVKSRCLQQKNNIILCQTSILYIFVCFLFRELCIG